MTILAAIRARHVEQRAFPIVCAHDGTTWPCDTAIVLAALDTVITNDRHVAVDLAAAIERERRQRAALRQAYTLLISAEPTLIRDAETGPNETSLHYKALLRDKVAEWLEPYRDDFDRGAALATTPEGKRFVHVWPDTFVTPVTTDE